VFVLGDCQVSILENAFARYFASGQVPEPIAPGTGCYSLSAFPTRDGYIVPCLSWGVENQWELFCATIGRAELIDDSPFDSGPCARAPRRGWSPSSSRPMKEKTTAEWVQEFDAIGLPCGPLNNVARRRRCPR